MLATEWGKWGLAGPNTLGFGMVQDGSLWLIFGRPVSSSMPGLYLDSKIDCSEFFISSPSRMPV